MLNCVIVLVHMFALLDYFVIGSMAISNDNQFVHHPKDHGAIGPFLPALPTPLCYCGLLAFVKQSRHPESVGLLSTSVNLSIDPRHLMPT